MNSTILDKLKSKMSTQTREEIQAIWDSGNIYDKIKPMENKDREKLKLSYDEANAAINDDLEGFKVIEKTITGNSRWSIFTDIVIQRESDGKYFTDSYSEGATENQDESPFEYTAPDFIEVFPKEKLITVYE